MVTVTTTTVSTHCSRGENLRRRSIRSISSKNWRMNGAFVDAEEASGKGECLLLISP